MRAAGLAALAAVIFQGVLGGLRVVLDERLLAKIHGCFGPAFFGLCVALAVFTSRRWRETSQPNWQPQAVRLHAVALLTMLFAYLQIVLGAQLRHVTATLDVSTFRTAVMFHLLVAGVLTLLILALTARVLRHYRHDLALLRPTLGLLALVGLQLTLGAATWVVNYNWPAWLGDYTWAQGSVVVQEGLRQTLVTTAHVAAGSLIFVTSLVVSLRSLRFYRVAAHQPAALPRSVGVLA
jgi:cytochrome c oxidase assembly protein subunit 15